MRLRSAVIADEALLTAPDDITPEVELRSRARVLLVEDDKALRRYLEVTLQRAGYEVLPAEDGLQAMKLALSASLDLVITDEVMPNLSGHELCRFLRNSPNLSHIPIILLSGLEREASGGEEALADAFLPKPVTAEKLTECVAGLVKGKNTDA